MSRARHGFVANTDYDWFTHLRGALEAAHIRDYHDVQEHAINNGILFGADVHQLFDSGYVTVTPEYRFKVAAGSKRSLRTDAITTRCTARPLVDLAQRAEVFRMKGPSCDGTAAMRSVVAPFVPKR